MVTEYHGLRNLSKRIERLPVKFIGGNLCLDFINTAGGRVHRGREYILIREKINSYEDLLAWGVRAGIVNRRPAQALAGLDGADVLSRAIGLRESLYRIFKSIIEMRRPAKSDAGVLRNEIAIARPHQRLVPAKIGFVWEIGYEPEAVDAPLWPVALSAADLLTSSDLHRLGQCPGADCGWLFLDKSRNHGRQWCDMADCGNRAKVRRFRAAQRD